MSTSLKNFCRFAGVSIVAAILSATAAHADVKSLSAGILSTAGIDKTVKPGKDIPKSTVRLGIMPYGDHSLLVIGIEKGFYNDVGISIAPAPHGETVQINDAVARLSADALDITTWYAPSRVPTIAQAPDLVMFGYHDVYLGTYMLAAPWAKAHSVSDFVAEGKSFDEAMHAAMAQMKGKRVAIANDGAHRDFLNTIFSLSDTTVADIKLQAIPDNQQIQLANSQRLDYASPSGGAQTVELMNQGWIPVAGTRDLLEGLPKDDTRAAMTVGNTGPAASVTYLENNYETALRFLSVQFRIVDETRKDPAGAYAIHAPFLQSVAGTQTTAADLEKIINVIDPLYTFEEQKAFWIEPESPWYYEKILAPQIKAAAAGGILPADGNYPVQQVTVGEGLYRDLVALKKGYDDLLPKVSGGDPEVLKAAATQYAHRNYLDAYRMIRTLTP